MGWSRNTMLKYLIEATLNDGTVIQQTQDDKSTTTEGKNTFYDVLQRIDDVIVFGVVSTDTAYTIGVNLIDGSFNANGVRFEAWPTDAPVFPLDVKYRLVYFKRVSKTFQGAQEIGESIVYNLGWQTTVDGKNFQQLVSVS
jgi:hypothetical protein